MTRMTGSWLGFVIVLALCFIFICPSFHGTLIPPSFLDCVVVIGRNELHPPIPVAQWVPEASGFLYGHFVQKIGDHNQYATYLVTNRHVIEEHAALTNSPLSVKFNLKNGGSTKAYDIPLRNPQGQQMWHFNPNPLIDVAVVGVNVNLLEAEGAAFSYFKSDHDLLTRSKAKELGLSEGDGVFVLGFPMGLVGQQQDYVIVRQGAIARVRDALEASSMSPFLVDSFIFPGNSGGPVVLKPEIVTISGAKPSINQAYLLGLVRGFIPYTDVAISAQTKRPRVTFEENSGLAEVIPADYIEETIQDLLRINPLPNIATPSPTKP
jgi:S1-C subfamily serine protease